VSCFISSLNQHFRINNHIVLGEFKTWDCLLSNRHEFKDIIDPAQGNKVIVKQARNTVPDQIMLQGIIGSPGVPISIHHRGGAPFPGTPIAEWRIQGDNGEIRITASSGSLNVGRPDTKIELFDKTTGEIEILVPEKGQWDNLPFAAHNIAKLYEAFRKNEWYPDFSWAVKRHEMIEEMWQRYDLSQNHRP
jgi:predicted dehydrogenase